MHPSASYIDPSSYPKRLLLPTVLVAGIRDREAATADQVRRQAGMRVGCVVGIPDGSGFRPVSFYGSRWLVAGKGLEKGGEGEERGWRGRRAIDPGEDGREAPGSNLGFGLFAGGEGCHYCRAS